MKQKTFICRLCGEIRPQVYTDKEVRALCREKYGPPDEVGPIMVCRDCYLRYQGASKAEVDAVMAEVETRLLEQLPKLGDKS